MRTRRFPSTVAAALAALALAGCGLLRDVGFAENEPDHEAVRQPDAPSEPAHVAVQHVLVAFEGSGVPGATRTKDEARNLALRVVEEARRGADFAELARLYSDDRGRGGAYRLANWGVPPGPDESERGRMVRGFGNAAFSLQPGEIALVEHDPVQSPLGWHVVKRVE